MFGAGRPFAAIGRVDALGLGAGVWRYGLVDLVVVRDFGVVLRNFDAGEMTCHSIESGRDGPETTCLWFLLKRWTNICRNISGVESSLAD